MPPNITWSFITKSSWRYLRDLRHIFSFSFLHHLAGPFVQIQNPTWTLRLQNCSPLVQKQLSTPTLELFLSSEQEEVRTVPGRQELENLLAWS